MFGFLTRDRRLPTFQRATINGGIIRERGIRNIRDNFTMLDHPHARLADHAADLHRIESPLTEHAIDFFLAALLRDQQHAFLGFTEQNLVRTHASLALRHPVHFNLNTNAAARTHLASGACQSRRAHVLNANDRAGLHRLEARFEQELLQKWIAHLDVRPLGFRFFAELLAGHGRAMNAVAHRLRPYINNPIAFARRLRVKDLVLAHQPERERVHQRIARVARLELCLPADVGDAEAVSVRSDAADYSFQDGMVAADISLRDLSLCGSDTPVRRL